MPRIFISHCAKHDPQCQIVIDRLLQDLNKDDIDLIWDRAILGVGDDWDDRLHTEIDTCDGAILLLSPVGLTRSYLIMECTLLENRKRRAAAYGSSFELLPVLVGGLAPADLGTSSMKDLKLNRYQSATDQDLDALVEFLRTPLDRLKVAQRRDTPRQGLLNDIVVQILASKPKSDLSLAKSLAINLPDWVTRSASLELRALAVAAEMPDKRLRDIGRALSEARDQISEASALAIVNRLAPFGVPGAAVIPIPVIASDVQRLRSVQINAADTQTGKWYAQLAYGELLRTKTTEVTNADRGLGTDKLFEEIVNAVLEATNADTTAEANEELKSMKPPFFVFVPCTVPDTDVVARVYKVFPTITLVFLTGESEPPAASRHPDVTLLEPLLANQHEQKALSAYTKTNEDVRKAHA